MTHSKGNWKVGNCNSVVTDNGEGFPNHTGHNDTEYYGGYLIAESILKPADAHLIAAAPDLLNANKENLEFLRWIASKSLEFNMWSDKVQKLFAIIAQTRDAINKAEGITDVEFEENEP